LKFVRELLLDQQRIVGLYDASITAYDPFPDRQTYEGIDPTLDGLDRLFTERLTVTCGYAGVETDLTYNLLNLETFKAWKFDLKGDFKQVYRAVDDLRVGMTLNPICRCISLMDFFDWSLPISPQTIWRI